MNTKTPQTTEKERKTLGAYYTPLPAARAIVDWAVRSREDTVFDPSFGGCAFFNAAIGRLRRLRCSDAFAQLAGADIDAGARAYLRNLAGYRRRPSSFRLKEDFLRLSCSDFRDAPFDVIVGNPPYIRHHCLTARQQHAAQCSLFHTGTTLPQTASYWSYFVLHALGFLRRGGRLGMVLPLALLQADYAAPVRKVFTERFKNLKIVFVRERLFNGVDEASVIVLADGWCAGGRTRQAITVGGIDELSRKGKSSSTPKRADVIHSTWRMAMLDGKTKELLSKISVRPSIRTLGDLATTRIGIVTGANGFFVLRPTATNQLKLADRYLRDIIKGASQLPGLEVTQQSMTILEDEDAPCKLFLVPRGQISAAARAYIATPEGQRASQAYKCSIRDSWFRITDTSAPHAFLSYLNDRSPRIVLNRAEALCTNSVHRLWWRTRLSLARQRLIALSFLTSLSALSGELIGRTYGGGVLKIEPSDAARLQVALPSLPTELVEGAFHAASKHMERRNWSAAREVADRIVLRRGLKLTSQQQGRLERATEHLRDLRMPLRRQASIGST